MLAQTGVAFVRRGRPLLVAIAATLILVVTSWPRLAQGESFPAYRLRLERAAAVLADAVAETGPARARAVAAALSDLPAGVPLDGLAPADLRYLREPLLRHPPDPAVAAARLAALRQALAARPAATTAQRDGGVLDTVLHEPPLNGQVQGNRGIWEAIGTLALDMLDRLFGARLSTNAGALTLIAAILGAATLLALLLAARRFGGSFVPAAARAADDAGGPGEPVDWRGAEARAAQLIDERQHRLALRYLFIACLLYLDEQGILRYDPALGNRGYVRGVAGDPRLAVPIRDLAERFEAVWYGGQPADAGTSSMAQALFARVRGALEGAARAT